MYVCMYASMRDDLYEQIVVQTTMFYYSKQL